MKKIAIVIQRYGKKVNGGSELHARWIVQRLRRHYDITVLTTCALKYPGWKNYYKEGQQKLDGIKLVRFKTEKVYSKEELGILQQQISSKPNDVEIGIEWLKAEGPYSPGLIHYLEENKKSFDIFVYFTYLFPTTFFGMQKTFPRNIILPLAHDEIFLRYKVFRSVFQKAIGIIYNSKAEKRLIHTRFSCNHIDSTIAGLSVYPSKVSAKYFYKKYGIKKFVLFVGRIDDMKGCPQLFQFFMKFKKNIAKHKDLKLILIGTKTIEIPRNKSIIHLGFVSDKDKNAAIKACKLLINPSPHESLSIVVLEAFFNKKPILVNGNCEVLRNHCEDSNGGRYFTDYQSFEQGMSEMLESKEALDKMGVSGYKYVKRQYSWTVVEKKWIKLIKSSLKESIIRENLFNDS